MGLARYVANWPEFGHKTHKTQINFAIYCAFKKKFRPFIWVIKKIRGQYIAGIALIWLKINKLVKINYFGLNFLSKIILFFKFIENLDSI